MEKKGKAAKNRGTQTNVLFNEANESGIAFNLPTDKSVGIIKVVGVGGGGCNAVTNMWKEGIANVTFAALNTDSQQLQYCPVPVKLQLGTEGLGVGGNPELGRKNAQESEEQIRQLLDDGTKMVFVTASMGGGTGTGAAPVVAGLAREMGLLTIGIVTIPFALEQRNMILKALRGVEEMRKNVDALLVVNNENLLALDEKDLSWEEAFKEADNIVKEAAKSISELITTYSPGCINVDFRDVETTLRNGGWAIMAAGRASGDNRLAKAFLNALSSPLLYGNDIVKAKRILIDVYTSGDSPMRIKETQQIYDFMKTLDVDIDMIFGTSKDDSLGGDAKVIILAAGSKEDKPDHASEQQRDEAYYLKLMEQLYPSHGNDAEPEEPAQEAAGQENTAPAEEAAVEAATVEEPLGETSPSEEAAVEGTSTEKPTEEASSGETLPEDGGDAAGEQPLKSKYASLKTFLEIARQWLLNLTNEHKQ